MNGGIIYFSGLILCSLYIIYIITMQITQAKKRKTYIRQTQDDYENAQKDLNFNKKKLTESITKIYGHDKAEKVNTGIIWIGMPMHLLMVALGKANNIKESNYKGKRTEKWFYGEYINRLGTYKYKLEILLENEEVVGWKDLF